MRAGRLDGRSRFPGPVSDAGRQRVLCLIGGLSVLVRVVDDGRMIQESSVVEKREAFFVSEFEYNRSGSFPPNPS